MVVKTLEGQLTDTPLPSYDPSGGDDDHPFDVAQVRQTTDSRWQTAGSSLPRILEEASVTLS